MHPSDAWIRSEREETGIYPDDWVDHLQGHDAWRECPWFLDYPEGEFPENERDAFNGENDFSLTFIWSLVYMLFVDYKSC